MLWFACLRLALDDGNSNSIQLKSLQSTVCSLHFIPGLQSTFYLQSAFYPQSAGCSLHFTLVYVLKIEVDG